MKTNSIALLPKHRITHLVRNPSFAKRVLFNRLKLIKRGVLRVHDQGEHYELGS